MASLALGPSRQFLRVEIHDWPYWIKRRQGSPSPFPVCRLCSALHSNPILRCFTSTLVFSRLCSQVTSCLYPFLISFGNFLLHVWYFEGVIREVLEFPCSARVLSSLRSCLIADLTIPAPFGSMRLRGVFTWENSHRRDFHTGMTFWFRIAFTWWRDYFISRLFERTVHLDKIHVRFKIANITHTLPVLVHLQLTPADRFNTETGGRFAFTWYRCEISYRSVILAPIQKPGWLAPV